MFSLFQRKPQIGVDQHIRRICALTAPDVPQTEDARQDTRYNRAIPVVIHPWDDSTPSVERLTVCLTNDLCDQGISMFVNREIHAKSVLIGFWLSRDGQEEPWFFRAEVKSSVRTGAGLWRYGTQVVEFMNQHHRKAIRPLFEATKRSLTFNRESAASV